MDQGMKLSYLGQCGFLLDFGVIRLVTDPYLSDYVDKQASSDAWPWQRLYPPPTDLTSLAPDVVLISHAHEDHMDPWTIGAFMQAKGKAHFICPAPEVDRLRQLGADHITGARADQVISLGELRITPIACAHTEFHQDDKGDYHELSYLIECNDICVLFGGDMSLYPGLEERLRQARPNLLLLPVNGRDANRTEHGIIGNMTSQEAAALSAGLGSPYVPMHHDLYANNGCDMAQILSDARDAGAVIHTLRPMQQLPVRPWPNICILGAGLSGRGFLARLLCGQARITFIDQDQSLVKALREAGQYAVRHFDGRIMRSVSGYEVFSTEDEACRQALSEADLVLSCVRAENAPQAGRWLASVCDVPVPIIACENALDPAASLQMDNSWQVESAAIFCTTIADGAVDILSEDVDELIVSRGPTSALLEGREGFQLVDSFHQLMMRKIYTYNAASAIIAYLGAEKGYEEFSQAARDDEIDKALEQFYDNVNLSICAEYGVDPTEQAKFAAASRAKFRNPDILDSVKRNAASPQRKLSAQERIIAPAQLIRKHGGNAQPLVKTAAAALRYAGVKHKEEAKLLLKSVSGLDENDDLMRRILDEFAD